MAELWSMATIFLLAFLGLVMVIIVIFFLWLAYRYDITFSIRTKDKAGQEADKEPADESVS